MPKTCLSVDRRVLAHVGEVYRDEAEGTTASEWQLTWVRLVIAASEIWSTS